MQRILKTNCLAQHVSSQEDPDGDCTMAFANSAKASYKLSWAFYLSVLLLVPARLSDMLQQLDKSIMIITYNLPVFLAAP